MRKLFQWNWPKWSTFFWFGCCFGLGLSGTRPIRNTVNMQMGCNWGTACDGERRRRGDKLRLNIRWRMSYGIANDMTLYAKLQKWPLSFALCAAPHQSNAKHSPCRPQFNILFSILPLRFACSLSVQHLRKWNLICMFPHLNDSRDYSTSVFQWVVLRLWCAYFSFLHIFHLCHFINDTTPAKNSPTF